MRLGLAAATLQNQHTMPAFEKLEKLYTLTGRVRETF